MAREQDVLVFHGAGEPRLRNGQVYWEPMLAQGLGDGYRIQAPRMPDPENPHYQAWADQIGAMLREVEPPILVGHSLGASVLLKYLASANPRPAYRGIFLVSTPFWKASMPEYALSPALLGKLPDLSPVFLYQSRDDEEVGVDHVEKYAKAMPQATVRILDGRGHEFNQVNFPELISDIRSLDLGKV